MVDAFAIQENFEVIGSDGDPIGLVDHLDDDGIKLKWKDGESGGKHHWIPVDWVERTDDKAVYLNKTPEEFRAQMRDTDPSKH